MKPTQMIAVIFGCAIAGGFIGTPIGWLVGVVSPGFVRGLFGGPENFIDDPRTTGIGLGIVNGIIFGLLTGAFVVVMSVIRENRRPND